MDNGQTNQTNLPTPERISMFRSDSFPNTIPSTSVQNTVVEDPFNTSITSGVGINPEEVNPDIASSLISEQTNLSPSAVPSRSSQANLGAKVLDPLLPPSPNTIEVDATKIAQYDPTAAPDLLNPTKNPQEQNLETQGALVVQEASEVPEQPEEKPGETTEAFIKIGQHFTGHDVAKVENAIKSAGADISSLYELIQNTREEQK